MIAEPRRRAILRMVWDEELAAGAIASRFDVRRDGTRRLYQANREALGPLGQVLEQMWATQLDELATLAEAAEREQRR